MKRKSKENQIEGIYVNDHLSKNSWQLLDKARELRNLGYCKYTWFNNGHVMIRKEENTRAVLIRGMEDLQDFKNQRDVEENTHAREYENGARQDQPS